MTLPVLSSLCQVFSKGRQIAKHLLFMSVADIIMPFIWSSTQAGRRGVTRNLVGHESAARVRIPAAPPKRGTPFGVSLFLTTQRDSKIKSKLPVAAWSMPSSRHRNNIFLRSRKCKRIPAAPPKDYVCQSRFSFTQQILFDIFRKRRQ